MRIGSLNLTRLQRYEIVVLKKENCSLTATGRLIGKDKSAVSKALSRNKDLRNDVYNVVFFGTSRF
ncbi:MAG: hypothetical protein EAZ70_04705 [Runella slithyformis]|nr:MAG: hypothetical protein EAY79_05065 [Runella slithyformis]TAE98260.1 MAG: hypothetical protein EAZ80_06580 [Runella slithyformis]TAF28654.1 MAG: hypothetical protein EAZ70_04705 [Runella slithyformis]TAF46661.1 MAG: hypothetical protein EAZ63_09260 [Runella slithyformis]TAF82371.1 MAG: hypothetical protein EAZ50_04210 [Runella slithyformis]